MRPIRTTRQFERDLKRARRRGKDLDKLWEIIEILNHGAQLEPRHHAHRLSGDWHPFWECHIEPDWLLIWHDADDALIHDFFT